MPTKVITKTVCTTCGKPTCDGGIWRFMRTLTDLGVESDPKTWPVENQTACTLRTGRTKFLKGKKVGDVVELYSNWVEGPLTAWVEKIEE